jgi:hypothetical protein
LSAELTDAYSERVGSYRGARLMEKSQLQGDTRRKFCENTRRGGTELLFDIIKREFVETTHASRLRPAIFDYIERLAIMRRLHSSLN